MNSFFDKVFQQLTRNNFAEENLLLLVLPKMISLIYATNKKTGFLAR